MSKISVAVIGATGYTGQELVRLLSKHPKVEIKYLTSRQNIGQNYSKIFPEFLGQVDIPFSKLNINQIAKDCQTVFLCLPHHEAMNTAAKFLNTGVQVIDLSADFRLKDSKVYEKWYGKHTQKKFINEAIYGLPELYASKLKKAKLIACPGCYPTSAILGLAPIAKQKIVQPDSIIIDSKSGVSGAGRSANIDLLYSELNENFKAYKIGAHRHRPEIEQEISLLTQETIEITFTPHLVPMHRGILSTIYVKLNSKKSEKEIYTIYKKFYEKKNFVQVLGLGSFPSTKNVTKRNQCQIGIHYNEKNQQLIIISAIDNLTKGASGQAVQCFNISQGLKETSGLL